ncbi:hypothetical protein CBFG_04882 [Clostridiales bacterium 1_7_47FAA]|nr:hypothetical protein CBFG_04882 [Clostridiales bacterium 1_7_47FAA]
MPTEGARSIGILPRSCLRIFFKYVKYAQIKKIFSFILQVYNTEYSLYNSNII